MALELLSGMGFIALTGLVIWDTFWKAFGMWYAARNNHKIWFSLILVLNTMGILPIVYLYYFRNKR